MLVRYSIVQLLMVFEVSAQRKHTIETHLVGSLTGAIMLVSTIASSSCLTGSCSDMGNFCGGRTTGNTSFLV